MDYKIAFWCLVVFILALPLVSLALGALVGLPFMSVWGLCYLCVPMYVGYLFITNR